MAKPMAVGVMIDKAYEARAKRIAREKEMEEEIKAMKAVEVELKEQIIAALGKQGLEKGSGEKYTASITRNVVPQVTDWDRVHAWVLKTKALEIFERRISKSAFKERYEAGVGIPGIDAREIEDLSLTKR